MKRRTKKVVERIKDLFRLSDITDSFLWAGDSYEENAVDYLVTSFVGVEGKAVADAAFLIGSLFVCRNEVDGISQDHLEIPCGRSLVSSCISISHALKV